MTQNLDPQAAPLNDGELITDDTTTIIEAQDADGVDGHDADGVDGHDADGVDGHDADGVDGHDADGVDA